MVPWAVQRGQALTHEFEQDFKVDVTLVRRYVVEPAAGLAGQESEGDRRDETFATIQVFSRNTTVEQRATDPRAQKQTATCDRGPLQEQRKHIRVPFRGRA